MQKIQVLIGLILGLLVTFIGTVLFVKLFTQYDYLYAVSVMKAGSNLGKLFSLGAVLNIILVYFLFNKNKDEIAKGIVFSMIVLLIITLIL